MANYYTLTGNLGGFMPPGISLSSLVAVVTTNLDGPVVDTAGNRVALGDVDVPVQANGDISVSLLQTDSADTNVSGWSYWLNVSHRTSISKVDGRGVTRGVARLGPFPLTKNSTLAELSAHFDTPAVDPTWRDGFRTEMEGLRDEAVAITDPEGIRTIAQGADAKATAAQAEIGGRLSPASLSATIGAALDGFEAGSRVKHLDAPAAFFGGVGNGWVTGQSTTPTTTTSPVTTGSTVLPVASAAGILVGVMLVLNRATADQQIVRVAAVAGTNVTIDKATTAPLAPGAAVEPLWVNNAHLTDEGYTAMAYWVARHPALAKVGGSKVTFLGNSWLDSRPMWAAQMVAKFPAATVVNKGKSFDTSALMLARFDADVPADSDYVIFNEPATNDMFYNPSTKSVLNNLVELIRKIEAIGAIPVYLGSVPHSDNPALAAQRAAIMDRDPGTYPGVAGSFVANAQMGMTGISATNHASGDMAMSKQPTGQGNSALGYQAMRVLTTGSGNTGVGKDAMIALTTGSSNTGVGQGALGAAQTANENTAVGFSAGAVSTGTLNTLIGSAAGSALTTGSGNLMLGRSAGSSLGKQTTTASNQTLVGTGAGQSAATQVNGIVAVGHLATAGAIDAVAIGRNAVANHARSVALGPATTTTAADQVMAGNRDVEITDATKGVILRSPDGTRYRITVANGGALSAVAV